MTERIELIRRGPDDEPVMSVHALALIVGASAEEVREVLADRPPDIMCLPKEWLQAGRRRSAEARAANGTHDLSAALLHLAVLDGDDVVMDPTAQCGW